MCDQGTFRPSRQSRFWIVVLLFGILGLPLSIRAQEAGEKTDGKRAFVGCEHSDGVHVIDMDKLVVEAVIGTGDGPDPTLIWFPPGT